jgi:hypothetical protein
MLLQFYQTHLESQLSTAEFIFLKILVNLLQSIKQVNLEKLANILPLAIKFESRRKRIQRFLAIPHFTIENIWLPLIKQLIESYLSPEEIIYLAIDRTNWGEINLLVISLIWQKRALPIFWQLLPKLGSSNLAEQQNLLSQVIPLFKNYKVCVLGDR